MTRPERAGPALGRRTMLAIAVSAIAFASSASAEAAAPLVDLQVVDRDTGQVLQVWRRGGRLFVAGEPGARYALRVANNTDRRVLAVMSVDGVNVITGQTAGYGQSGYVLGPYQTYDVSGWRKSDTEVAAFTFAPLPQSYAARTGRPFDVGVIGLAVFQERVVAVTPIAPLTAAPAAPPTTNNEVSEMVVTGQKSARVAAPAPPPPAGAASRPAPPADVAEARRSEKLGTAHGAREWSYVRTVAFERATAYPQWIQRIEYDTYENLVAANVIPRPWAPARPPRPFPMDGRGYVPDPPGGR